MSELKAMILVKFMKKIPLIPEEPVDCCGKGCNPCVFDAYDEKIEKRRNLMDELLEKIKNA